jgi:CelD/BcsL family acetyltransferase involved in cellulose biosynthesis
VSVYTFDPLGDPRWPVFVESHPAASIFHTRGWLEALQSTYGYEPIVYTTSRPSEDLTSAVPLCRIQSWLTGRRLVSLPFSDHCDPLVEQSPDREAIVAALRQAVSGEHLTHIELRPRASIMGDEDSFVKGSSFVHHMLDLRPDLEQLRRTLHKGMIERKIRRAEREGVSYEEGTSESLLRAFFRLMLLTRRRHGVAPQPLQWFRNLIACLGDRVKIRVASRQGRTIASILTLQHRDTLVYKYGCSDARFHSLGAMPFLLWKAIEDAKAQGLRWFDFGRSDLSNTGLIAFKDRWGAVATTLTYVQCCPGPSPKNAHTRPSRIPRALMARLPDSALVMAGRLIYRHLG